MTRAENEIIFTKSDCFKFVFLFTERKPVNCFPLGDFVWFEHHA